MKTLSGILILPILIVIGLMCLFLSLLSAVYAPFLCYKHDKYLWELKEEVLEQNKEDIEKLMGSSVGQNTIGGEE